MPPSAMLQSALLQQSEPLASSAALVLEVSRGQTRFPHRRVRAERFLIGGGVGCDLQIGGSDMPPLHSLLHQDEGRYRLESLAEFPELHVNGDVVQSAIIREGDSISIGAVEFFARFIPTVEEAENVAATAASGNELIDVNEILLEEEIASTKKAILAKTLSGLSAEQLVDLIDDDERLIADNERRRELAVSALLHAASQAGQKNGVSDDDISESDISESDEQFDNDETLFEWGAIGADFADESNDSLLHGLGQVVEQIGLYAAELERRVLQSSQQQEASQEQNRSQQTIHFQSEIPEASDVERRRLSERLQSLLGRISPEEDSSGSPRSVA